jgi:hypothetical protein
MGINKRALYGMLYAVENGVDFTHSLTIGRLTCYLKPQQINIILGKYDSHFNENKQYFQIMPPPDDNSQMFSEGLFQYLGAKTVDSIDYSDYEGATILHDMNTAIPNEQKNKYTCVWDGGALEHIFNFPQAVKNCMDMVKINGHLVLDTVANNFFGHGFYQFSPELFFSLLSRQNGFDDTRILINDDKNCWYRIISPNVLKQRIELCCAKKKPCSLIVISKKIGTVPLQLSVFQSDYVLMWNNDQKLGHSFNSKNFLHRIYRNIPEKLRILLFPVKIRRLFFRYLYFKDYYIPEKIFMHPKKISHVRVG